MSFVGYRTFMGDATHYAEMSAVGRSKMIELGASDARTSMVLTGPAVGSSQIATMFDSIDAYYEASAAALGSVEIQSALAAANATQTNAGLIEDVDRLPGRAFTEFPCQLDPLSLATGKSR